MEYAALVIMIALFAGFGYLLVLGAATVYDDLLADRVRCWFKR